MTRRIRRRNRVASRGFTMATMLEVTAVMGWFVVLLLSERYLDEGVRQRRAVEHEAQQRASMSAMGFCMSGGGGGGLRPARPVPVRADVKIAITGMPEMASMIPSLISGLGFDSLKTMPLYTLPLQGTEVSAVAEAIEASTILGHRSGGFHAESARACLERPLADPGGALTMIKDAAKNYFIQSILGI